PDARVGFQMIVWPEAREGADDDAVIEAAFRYHAVRLDNHVVAEDRVAEHAAGADGAARAEFRLTEKLHAGLEHGVFAGAHVGIDQHGFRQLHADAPLHQFRALTL